MLPCPFGIFWCALESRILDWISSKRASMSPCFESKLGTSKLMRPCPAGIFFLILARWYLAWSSSKRSLMSPRLPLCGNGRLINFLFWILWNSDYIIPDYFWTSGYKNIKRKNQTNPLSDTVELLICKIAKIRHNDIKYFIFSLFFYIKNNYEFIAMNKYKIYSKWMRTIKILKY